MPDGSGTSTVILTPKTMLRKFSRRKAMSQRINEYIKERHECLNNIAHQEPQKHHCAGVIKWVYPPRSDVKIRARQLIISESWLAKFRADIRFIHLSQKKRLKILFKNMNISS